MKELVVFTPAAALEVRVRLDAVSAPILCKKLTPAEIGAGMERAWRVVIWRHWSNFQQQKGRWYGAWENWYMTSVEGDTRKPKLSVGTEMVLCPFSKRAP